jgi:hypothetical protein
MLTIRASQGVEFEALVADMATKGVAAGRGLTEFRAGFLAGAGVQPEGGQQHASHAAPQAAPAAYQAPQQQYQAPAPQGAPQAPQTGATGAAPSCPHGVKEYKTGVNKQGRPYKAWFCPSQDKNNQCKPEWLS